MEIITRSLIILGIIFLMNLIYAFIEPLFLVKKVNEIKSKKISDRLNGLKIIFVSDIHQGKLVSIDRVKKIVRKINEETPDLVLMGGDYITWGADVERCFEEIGKIKSKYGIYGIMGNHEHKTGLYKAIIHKMNIYNIGFLDNQATLLDIENEKLNIGGVGDLLYDKQDVMPTILNAEKYFTILLSHNPDYIEVLKDKKYTNKIDLMLSGDTHGGQVTFFGIWSPFLRSEAAKKHRTGMRQIDSLTMIVSNGAGVLGVPLRLFAPAQINLIILKSDK